MLAARIRNVLAVLLCLAGGLGYWFGYRYIVSGEALGVPFGWGFGTALAISMVIVPLAVDRDDPSIKIGQVIAALGFLIVACAALGAGIVLHGSPMFFVGVAAGVIVGLPLSYWAFGDDRKRRGVPRRITLAS